MDLYRLNILDHYKNPRNFGEIGSNSKSSRKANPSCGDRISIDLKIKNNKVEDIKFQGEGCALSVASASMLTEAIKGKKITEVKKLDFEDIKEILNIDITPARKRMCYATA